MVHVCRGHLPDALRNAEKRFDCWERMDGRDAPWWQHESPSVYCHHLILEMTKDGWRTEHASLDR